MPTRTVPLEAVLYARLEATREVLLDFEASVVRLPPDLRMAVRTLRRVTEETQARLPATLAALPRDAAARRDLELIYVNFVRKLWRRAQVLATGTNDPSLPGDLVPLMHQHLTEPGQVALILRTTTGPTFESFSWPDVVGHLEDEWVSPSPPTRFDVSWRPPVMAFIEIPQALATATFLHLVGLGHELAHLEDDLLQQQRYGVMMGAIHKGAPHQEPHGYVSEALKKVDFPKDAPEDFVAIVERWSDELFADLVSVRRYGPAAAFALAELSELVAAYGVYQETHPPAEMRLSVMLTELRPFLERRLPARALTKAAFDALRTEALSHQKLRSQAKPQYREIVKAVLDALPVLRKAAAKLVPTPYKPDRLARIEALAGDLAAGIARSDTVQDDALRTTTELVADLFNAAAVVRHSPGIVQLASAMTGMPTPAPREVAAAMAKADRLLAHALAGVHLAEEWRKVQGSAAKEPARVRNEERPPAARAILAPHIIRRRLASRDKDRIVVTPLLDPSVAHGTLDMRLGREFIAFRKTRYLGVDPIGALRDAARMIEDEQRAAQRQLKGNEDGGDQPSHPELLERRSQDELHIRVGRTVERIFVPFRETFVLHPHQLVLACTLEYVCLPEDVGAYVLSRSSIGRLGILSATATFIHPGFCGVITLELVNTSETPVRVTPGMRIAQLVFEHADPAIGEPPGRYQFSTGPEITLLTSDRELQRLAEVIRQET